MDILLESHVQAKMFWFIFPYADSIITVNIILDYANHNPWVSPDDLALHQNMISV